MIEGYENHTPKIDPTAYVHPTAVLIGRVTIGALASVWPHTVLRGDDGDITIGARTSIQDGTVCHLTHGWSNLIVGDEVTVGHKVILHGCRIADRVLVGMGSILLDNAEVGEYCVIGAGSLVTANKVIPPRSLVLGNPAKIVREVSDREIAMIMTGMETYVAKAKALAR